MGDATRGRLLGAMSAFALTAAVVVAGALIPSGAGAATIGLGALSGGTQALTSASCGKRSVTTSIGTMTTGKKGRLACRPAPAALQAAGYSGPAIRAKAGKVTWNIASDTAFSAVSFALTNARSLKKSFFNVLAGGATWELSRGGKGEIRWVTVYFDEPVDTAKITLRTKRKDAFRIADTRLLPPPANGGGGENGGGTGGDNGGGGPGPIAGGPGGTGGTGGGNGVTPAPIPLPPAALLLGVGVVALAGVRRRRRPA